MRRRGFSFSESGSVEDSSEINVSPLLDMVFILLIFFVVTSTFVKEAGVDIKKPKANSATAVQDESLRIAITREGNVYVNDKQVEGKSLEVVLKREKANRPTAKVIIIADARSVTASLVEVIDKCNQVGLREVSLAAMKED